MTLSPKSPSPLLSWLQRNLFNSWFNTGLTIVSLLILGWGGWSLLHWILAQAQWEVVSTNLSLFWVGRYPADQVWRLWIALALVLAGMAGWVGALRIQSAELKQRLQNLYWVALPVAIVLILWLIGGGLGLTKVGTTLWGGLMLTLVVSVISIGLAFPLGVLLALGRRSELPVVKWGSTLYIELVRGLPLIGILFMAQVMLPLILPGQWRWDRVVRAIAGLVLFNAAYLAENVRGGLQSIPRGQTEAAKALGFNTPLTLGLIVLPQALRVSIPAIVGQFISLFKDTSLLSLFALVELSGVGRAVLAQQEFLGRYAEVYLFIGVIYWIFCYGMAQISRRLERSR